MAEVQKGVVTSIEDKGVRVKPYTAGSQVTPPLVYSPTVTVKLEQVVPIEVDKIEVTVDGKSGSGTGTGKITVPVVITAKKHPPLKVNDVVTFAMFEDGTGVILTKMGGA